MDAPAAQPAMSQQIFNMGLSTEAISLYLLCCHLQDTHAELSGDTVRELWNGSLEALSQSIDHLEGRKVLSRSTSPSGGTVYRVNRSKDWLTAG